MPQNNNEEELVFVDRDAENGGCTRTIEKKVSVAAQVTIKPIVHVRESDIEMECCGPPTVKRLRKKKNCGKNKSHRKKQSKADKCKFLVQQDLRVRIPIHFDTKNEVKPLGVICDSGSGPCDHVNDDTKDTNK
ncbi:hypothetical protein [Sporosarcina ureilytica]|uniref:Uncharacterized protein n=1 Tax=Sporosarcina ureilytica TaxID=298596 RepID=A0A1D8JCX2_9BACL|nr:hypothetical protein [Sporosarcina ureilytica]AOV06552.1 hypothetical protein BI350_02280 [Sporosarcina ureilytica]